MSCRGIGADTARGVVILRCRYGDSCTAAAPVRRQQQRADAVDIGVRCSHAPRSSPTAAPFEHSVRIAQRPASSTLARPRLVLLLLRRPAFKPTRARAVTRAIFGGRIARRFRTRAPQPVRLLQGRDPRAHFPEELLVARARRMLGRQVLQHACQTREHPAIAAAPEDLLAVGLALRDETAVAEVQMLARIIQEIGCLPPPPVELSQVARVASGLVEHTASVGGPEQRVTPAHSRRWTSLRQSRGSSAVERRSRRGGTDRRQHRLVAVPQVQLDVHLPDAVVVGEVLARARLPSAARPISSAARSNAGSAVVRTRAINPA